MREVRTGEIYRHFKGELYQIVAVARHSETNESYVVYQALYGDMQVWVRPYDMFVGEVDHAKYPQVKQRYRFELLNTLAGAVSMNNTLSTTGADSAKTADEVHTDGTALRTQDTKKAAVGTGDKVSAEPHEDYPDESHNYSELERQGVDVRLLEFLDAPTYQDKINYLNLIRANIDDNLINNIAAAMDITVDDGPIDTRFFSLRSCLMTKAKYECARR